MKHVFIDWDGTLSVSRFWGHWASGTDRHDYERVQQTIFSDTDLGHAWMRGQISAEQVISIVSSTTDINHERLFEALSLSSKSMTLADPAVLQRIAELRTAGIGVSIATDNMDTFRRWTTPALDLDAHFDHLLVSSEIGALKKDVGAGGSAFFGPFLDTQGLAAIDCILIDDSPSNKVVESFGMRYQPITSPAQVSPILSNLVKQLTV